MNPSAPTKEALTFTGIGWACAVLIAGGLADIWHITLTPERESALALICAALIHRFFSQGAR